MLAPAPILESMWIIVKVKEFKGFVKTVQCPQYLSEPYLDDAVRTWKMDADCGFKLNDF